MAATLVFLILFATNIVVEAQQRPSNISLGSTLTPTPTTTTNSSWLSRSGLYAFGFYQQGNGYAVGVFLAGIPEKTVVWTANRDNSSIPGYVTLALTSDGRLILQQPQSQDNYTNVVDVQQPASAATMLDSGNFVLYGSDQKILWQSFDNPTDTILPGQRLSAGKGLFSSASETDHSTGIFRLTMQHDGNLVQYPVETVTVATAYWSSGTFGAGDNVSLNLDDNGHLYLLNATGANIGNLYKGDSVLGKSIYLMRIDADGIFRVRSRTLVQNGSSWSVQWESTGDKCDPKGLCGLNGYCVTNDTQAECTCLPGFDFVNPGNWTAGCERNFTADHSCKNTGGSVEYEMSPLVNTIWEDVSYSALQLRSKEECAEACLKDCNCEAALYKDGKCTKQRLPLRYGRRLLRDTGIAFIKVGKSAPIIDGVPADHLPKKEQRIDILIIGFSLAAFAFMVLTASGVLVYKNQVWVYRKISENGNAELSEDIALRVFTFTQLEQVTDGFKEELGRGAFGTVYKGIIPYNQKVVAVKRLDKVLTEGEREFQTEIKVIGRTNHRNLVRLIGYCLDGLNRLLVYEYMSNGSLADFLFTPENRPSWDERIAVARDIARGILYLHEECETQIIHCDIKPQNILMDGQRCAKIGDFGLAKLLKPDQTKTSTGIRGTRGYVAPEWHRKLPITVKADVFSFGVVLLEIICCRKCLDWSLSEEEAVLEEWVSTCFEARELSKLVDDDEEVDKRKLERMVRVGLWCIQDEPSLRPSMKKVLLMLEGTVDIPAPPSPTSFLSAI